MLSFFLGALSYALVQNGMVLKTLEKIVPVNVYNTIVLMVSVSFLMMRIAKLKLIECLRSCKSKELVKEVVSEEVNETPEKPVLRMRKPRVVKDFLEENGHPNKNY